MTVPSEVVKSKMFDFEEAYNVDDTSKSASTYADDCLVTVNGGVESGGPFTGKTPAEVAGFLSALRNDMGGTNMHFVVTDVTENIHTDKWTADNGTGACTATWKQFGDDWKIVKDEILFWPKGV
eukprot:CFRG7992T1